MVANADELREVIEELSTIDERRGYLKARLEHLLADDRDGAPARPTLVTPRRSRAGRPSVEKPSSTPGLRVFIEQVAARKGLDLATVSRGELKGDIIAKYPDVAEDVLMARLSNNLKSLRTLIQRDAATP
jgi:hypothetical protein